MEAFQRGQATFPAVKTNDHILGEVQLLQLWHSFKVSKTLEFVVISGENSQVRVSSPSFIDFLKLVTADVEVIELGTLESRPFDKLVEGDIQLFKIGEALFHGKDVHVLNLVVGQREFRQSR